MTSTANNARPDPRIAATREALLEGVGAEVAASFPGITRLGGQVVAALYLSDGPRSMDQLALELGRSKSNIFSNLRGLEGAGIIERRREPGNRHDSFALRGRYPDVVVGAYIARLRRVVHDKQTLCRRSIEILGDARGAEADGLRERLDELIRKYDLFAELMENTLPAIDGPIDVEKLLQSVPASVLSAIQVATRAAWTVGNALSHMSGRVGRRSKKG